MAALGVVCLQVEEDLFKASGQSRARARGAGTAAGISRCLGPALAGLVIIILSH